MIVDYLNKIVKLQKNNYSNGRPYVSIEHFILKNGNKHKPQKFDSNKFTGVPNTPRECFRNAWHLANMHGLIYVEGIANNHFPTLHAWCIDTKLNVYDPTWDNSDKCLYYGVMLNMKYVAKILLETGVFCVLDNPIQGFPLLSGADTDFIWKPKS